VRLDLTQKEALVLTLVTGVGATAFDSPLGQDFHQRFERKFNVTISGDDIANIIHKVRSLTQPSGTEEVEID
jgi:hypothetical protein